MLHLKLTRGECTALHTYSQVSVLPDPQSAGKHTVLRNRLLFTPSQVSVLPHPQSGEGHSDEISLAQILHEIARSVHCASSG
jgi:hypothetical protein